MFVNYPGSAGPGTYLVRPSAPDGGRGVQLLRQYVVSATAALIGETAEPGPPLVTLRSVIGANRISDLPGDEQLSRICRGGLPGAPCIDLTRLADSARHGA